MIEQEISKLTSQLEFNKKEFICVLEPLNLPFFKQQLRSLTKPIPLILNKLTQSQTQFQDAVKQEQRKFDKKAKKVITKDQNSVEPQTLRFGLSELPFKQQKKSKRKPKKKAAAAAGEIDDMSWLDSMIK